MKQQTEKLIKELAPLCRATNPVDPDCFRQVPHFDAIFPAKELWPVLVRLSGDDGIAYIERKQVKPGEKLISRGKFDQMIYWILGGSLNIVAEIKGHAKVVHRARQGECVGELGVLRGAIRNADVVGGEQGAEVLELDWAITDKNAELGKDFYQLIALHLADKLDNAYSKELEILVNSITILQQKTSQLIDKNRQLQKIVQKHHLAADLQEDMDQTLMLGEAIANIRESLSLLQQREDRKALDRFGVV
ncbi:MAG: cyclic nucleotide-binding domain-containing protein [Thermodesulfobacteriota bacterium]